MLPANGPILKALRLPRFMGITRVAAVGVAAQLAQLDAALAGGLRLIQVREPAMPYPEFLPLAREVVRRAHAQGALVVINGADAAAREAGADGVHLSAVRLAGQSARPDFAWVGASCHGRRELEQAAVLGLDYALLGAVQPTPSHPDRASLGWETFAELVTGLPMPVLALGGLGRGDMDRARGNGAHGIAAIRGAWSQSCGESSDRSPLSGGAELGTR
jgi:8-oxo-dGTP diphosphatase